MIYKSERKFQLWEYSVSHSQLLLRSPRSPEFPEITTNIDLIFLGVAYLQLPSMFLGLKLDHATARETAKVLGSLLRVSDPIYVYSLRSKGRPFYIAAAVCRVYENHLDLCESSLEDFSADEESKDLGKLLAHS